MTTTTSRGRSRNAPCPLCPARRGLSITECADGSVLVHCHACHASQAALRAALPDLPLARHAAPRAPQTLAPGVMPNPHGDGAAPIHGAFVSARQREAAAGHAPIATWAQYASYRYVDADGWLCGVVDRWHGLDAAGVRHAKLFSQRRPKFPTLGWHYDLGGHSLPLYRLDLCLARPEGAPLVLAEGEKDVEALRAALPGWAVSTCPGGAHGWRDVHTASALELTRDGSEIWLVRDPDAAGAAWQRTIVAALGRKRLIRAVA